MHPALKFEGDGTSAWGVVANWDEVAMLASSGRWPLHPDDELFWRPRLKPRDVVFMVGRFLDRDRDYNRVLRHEYVGSGLVKTVVRDRVTGAYTLVVEQPNVIPGYGDDPRVGYRCSPARERLWGMNDDQVAHAVKCLRWIHPRRPKAALHFLEDELVTGDDHGDPKNAAPLDEGEWQELMRARGRAERAGCSCEDMSMCHTCVKQASF